MSRIAASPLMSSPRWMYLAVVLFVAIASHVGAATKFDVLGSIISAVTFAVAVIPPTYIIEL
jgi:hypothetical protein